jgi:hypothetical protein
MRSRTAADMTAHTATTASLESSPWWLYLSEMPRNCPKQCAMLCHTILVVVRTSTGVSGPQMDPPWGKCAPSALENCALVIPLSKSVDVCLKLIAWVYCEMGPKNFPGSELMIAREPRMCPPQVSHS